jgi:hypothetical protein
MHPHVVGSAPSAIVRGIDAIEGIAEQIPLRSAAHDPSWSGLDDGLAVLRSLIKVDNYSQLTKVILAE